MPAETHVEKGPLDRQEVFELVRDQLADILEIEPVDHQRVLVVRRGPGRRLPRPDRAGRGLEEELGERTVGFRIEDEDLEDLRTVRDAVDYVVRQARRRA